MPAPYDPLKNNVRAMEAWFVMVAELEDTGFTAHEGRSAWVFTCRHGKVRISVYRNLKAYQDGDWEHAVRVARAEERRLCR